MGVLSKNDKWVVEVESWELRAGSWRFFTFFMGREKMKNEKKT